MLFSAVFQLLSAFSAFGTFSKADARPAVKLRPKQLSGCSVCCSKLAAVAAKQFEIDCKVDTPAVTTTGSSLEEKKVAPSGTTYDLSKLGSSYGSNYTGRFNCALSYQRELALTGEFNLKRGASINDAVGVFKLVREMNDAKVSSPEQAKALEEVLEVVAPKSGLRPQYLFTNEKVSGMKPEVGGVLNDIVRDCVQHCCAVGEFTVEGVSVMPTTAAEVENGILYFPVAGTLPPKATYVPRFGEDTDPWRKATQAAVVNKTTNTVAPKVAVSVLPILAESFPGGLPKEVAAQFESLSEDEQTVYALHLSKEEAVRPPLEVIESLVTQGKLKKVFSYEETKKSANQTYSSVVGTKKPAKQPAKPRPDTGSKPQKGKPKKGNGAGKAPTANKAVSEPKTRQPGFSSRVESASKQAGFESARALLEAARAKWPKIKGRFHLAAIAQQFGKAGVLSGAPGFLDNKFIEKPTSTGESTPKKKWTPRRQGRGKGGQPPKN